MSCCKNKFCHKPWEMMEIVHVDFNDQVTPNIFAFVCCNCWVNTPIGDVTKTSIGDTYNSRKAQKIRQSVLDGDFSYCDKQHCPHIQNDSLPTVDEILNNDTFLWDGIEMNEEQTKKYRDIIINKTVTSDGPEFLHLSYDESCNLSCPSCRCEKVSWTEGPLYEHKKKAQQKVIDYAFGEPHNKYIHLSITGSGDPFGSKLFRELLFNIDGSKFPNVYINLQTNGVMFTPKYWDKMKRIHSNIDAVLISVDAGTEETYNVVRRGGNWKQLMANLDFLSEKRKLGEIKYLRLDMIVQKRNYKEMVDLVKIAQRIDSNVYFASVQLWEPAELSKDFDSHAVWKEDHPEHKNFLEILQNPIFDDPRVDLGNLTEYRACLASS